jgi:N-methylhydantoinase A
VLDRSANADGGPVIYRIGADIGGTFTDVVLIGTDGSIATKKVSSTPESFGRAIVEGVSELIAEEGVAADGLAGLAHASTVATNAIIELKGARTGLITTKGFRDVLEMRRLRIPVLYDLQYRKPPPLVPRRLRLEVDERMGPRGAVWAPLDEGSVVAAAKALNDAGVQSIAISLLHSYADPTHERRVAEIVRNHVRPDVYVTCSADVLPEIREYERTSTAVVSAYVGPVVRDYLDALERDIRGIGIGAPLQIMQSNGGIMSLDSAREKPAYTVESGPAAGVIASARMARALGLANAISLDMGGTTAKAAMIENGEPARTTEYEVGSGINLSSKLVKGGGYPIKLPFIDVSEIGAGGGSIVSLDAAGNLSVGPRSAGAVPGPVCYGAGGTEPTFTDAALAAGYLNPAALAGGRVKLDAATAIATLQEQIAKPLGLPLAEAAYGIYTIAAATMTRAVKAVTTYRGRDPRDFVLIGFGGNGPMVAAAVARALSIRKVLIPPAPGVFSALGLLMSEIEHEFSSSVFRATQELSEDEFANLFAGLESLGRAAMAQETRHSEALALRRFAELRYSGQAYELTIPVAEKDRLADVAANFHDEHRKTYGHGSNADPVDIVSIRLYARVVGEGAAIDYERLATSPQKGADTDAAPVSRRAYFGRDVGFIDTPVIPRGALGDAWCAGPLIVEEYDATCVVPHDARARLDALGNIEIELPEEAE